MLDHILVPLDGSTLAESALPYALGLAQAFGSRLTLLRVVEQSGENQTIDPLDWHIEKTEAESYLDAIAARCHAHKVQVEKVLLEGRPASHMIDYAQNHNVDLMILSTHGKSGISDFTLGSVVQKAIQSIGRSVLLVPASHAGPDPAETLQYKRILVPLDGSLRAEHVLPLANTLSSAHKSQLLLAHVVNKPEMPRRTPLTQEDTALIDRITERNQEEGVKYLEQLQSRLEPGTQTRLLVSENATVTLHDLTAQEHVDLIIMSAHGYSGEARWPYGSLVTSFLFYGNTPLLIVQDLPTDRAEVQPDDMTTRTAGRTPAK